MMPRDAVQHQNTARHLGALLSTTPNRTEQCNQSSRLAFPFLTHKGLTGRQSPSSIDCKEILMPDDRSPTESKKFRPHIFIPLCSTNNLQSEKHRELALDQFDALNLPVPPNLP